MAAIVTVLVVVLASLIVNRVATIALTLTGLSQQAARFQARSALTGTGFTTSEAESIVTHPIRRRIIMTLMLIGSAGVITVIGGFVIGFVGSSESDWPAWAKFLTLVGGLGLILGLFNIPSVDRGLQRMIRRLLRRYTDLDVRDYASLLHIFGDYSVSEMRVEEGHWMNDQTLADLRLNDEGVLVLGIQRGEDEYIGAPKGHHELKSGDVLVIYGPGDRLEDLDRRPAGIAGTQAHRVATAQQRQVVQEERAEPESSADGDGSAGASEPRQTVEP